MTQAHTPAQPARDLFWAALLAPLAVLLLAKLGVPWPLTALLFGITAIAILQARTARRRRDRHAQARRVLAAYRFPTFLLERVRARHPELTGLDLALVEQGLRQFFQACIDADGAYVAMPSAAVDAMWHEFVLYTVEYQRFCLAVFGRVLHHTPDEALPRGWGSARKKAEGLRRAWAASCRAEGLDPRRATGLPALFAADAVLAMSGGFEYDPQALAKQYRRAVAADGGSSCGSGCGSSSADGCADGGSCGGSGCGGGSCGGGGCGGGCGGGD